MKQKKRHRGVKITIKKATIRDLERLVSQRHRMFEDIVRRSPNEHAVADRLYRKWIVDMIRKKRFAAFLAVTEEGGYVAGGCVWIRETQPSPRYPLLRMPYLLSMYTEPEFRGIGLAARIVKVAMNWSKKKGYSMMSLHASVMGRRVYKKLGWKRTWEMRVNFSTRRSRKDAHPR
ncbi:MAG: GNAT family N-acetyltransferase [Nitrososphaerales archaeon]